MRQRASRTRTCWEEARAGVSAQSRGDVARSSAQGPGGAACVRQAPAVVGMARWYPEPNSSCSGALLSEVAGKKLLGSAASRLPLRGAPGAPTQSHREAGGDHLCEGVQAPPSLAHR